MHALAAAAAEERRSIMSDPVELRLLTSDSFPSGTGSFTYKGVYQIVVQNIAFQKQVAIRGATGGGTSFVDHAAQFSESLADGRELWKLETGVEMLEFVVKYEVAGTVFWDNNAGANYKQPPVFDEFDALLGHTPQIVLGTSRFSDATHVQVLAAVKNLAFVKQVGMLFSTDGGASFASANGQFSRTLKSGNELWRIDASVGPAKRVEFALFYRVNGQEYWDNDFWRNYFLVR
jgi:carbohydrate/starch-binding protein with CBM21 domain